MQKISNKVTVMNVTQLSDLVKMDSPEAVLEEVLIILDLISPNYNTAPVTSAFTSTVNLFNGSYPGYRACNTEYHDLHHTTDTFLAMARLIHGAVIEGYSFSVRLITLGLIAALLHDAGFVQEEHDREGTGAKYTTIHVQRSMNFLELHGAEYGLSDEEIASDLFMILCTNLAVDISNIMFPSSKVELLGKILGVADLLAQMADRTYLEKLLFLYHELREAKVSDYESEEDFLRKTVGFYDFIAQRFETVLDATDRFMSLHLTSRWDIQEDLYHESIEKQKKYLQQILEITDSDPLGNLRRGGIVDKVRQKYGNNFIGDIHK
ncbi:MAG: hypothetical protein V3S72_11715 [Desulfobacterales bacterium]